MLARTLSRPSQRPWGRRILHHKFDFLHLSGVFLSGSAPPFVDPPIRRLSGPPTCQPADPPPTCRDRRARRPPHAPSPHSFLLVSAASGLPVPRALRRRVQPACRAAAPPARACRLVAVRLARAYACHPASAVAPLQSSFARTRFPPAGPCSAVSPPQASSGFLHLGKRGGTRHGRAARPSSPRHARTFPHREGRGMQSLPAAYRVRCRMPLLPAARGVRRKVRPKPPFSRLHRDVPHASVVVFSRKRTGATRSNRLLSCLPPVKIPKMLSN